MTGKAWQVNASDNLYHDYSRLPVHYAVRLGMRYLGDKAGWLQSIPRCRWAHTNTLITTISNPISEVSTQAPYCISEAASGGPGVMLRHSNENCSMNKLDGGLFLSGILLGGTKSDYYNVIDRDYNLGMGYSVKAQMSMEWHHRVRLMLNGTYYYLYTKKGYNPDTDLGNMDHDELLHLNAQGNASVSSLLKITPA